jgi:hypothetical protein
VVKPVTSLPIVPKKRRSTSTTRTKTRRTKARRKVKLILMKNGSQMMIVTQDEKKKKKGAANIAIHHPSSPAMIFPDSTLPPKLFPNLSSSPRLFSNLIDNENYTLTCLMAKGEKLHVSLDPSSDEYDSCDENIEQIEATMIKKFGKKTYTKIKMLMKKLEKRDRCLEMQGGIITQEREKNQALEASITEEKSKVEKLTIELSLVNDSFEKLTKEHSLVNDQVASLKNEKSIAQESLTSFEEKYCNLELLLRQPKSIAQESLFGLALQLLLRQLNTLMSPLAMVVKDAIRLM